MTKPNATWPSCGLNKCWKDGVRNPAGAAAISLDRHLADLRGGSVVPRGQFGHPDRVRTRFNQCADFAPAPETL